MSGQAAQQPQSDLSELPLKPATHVGEHPGAVRLTFLEELVVVLVVPAQGAGAGGFRTFFVRHLLPLWFQFESEVPPRLR